MRKFTYMCVVACLLIGIAGCGKSDASSEVRADELGAWIGTGTFTAQAGSQAMKAQLELLADGNYRFMVLEPRMLMVTMGLEQGTWKRAEQQILLTPIQDQKDGGGIISQAPKNFRPKQLTIEPEFSALTLKDDKLDMRFTLNWTATEKLQAKGEI